MVFSLNQILNISPLELNQIVPQTWGKISLEFTATYSLKSEKDWPVDFAKL